MALILVFLAGALLCNAIPHLAAGLRGEPFQTPFAKPPGIGLSSPTVNVFWGSFNLGAGALILRDHWQTAGTTSGSVALAAGFLALGLFAARHFGGLRGH
jgi:hypothetical protein